MKKVGRGDTIILLDERGKRCILHTDDEPMKIKGFGVVHPRSFIGMSYGEKTMLGTKHVWILPPSSYDRWGSLKRKAQIILPKDAAQIIVNCSIVSGSIVVEGGIGSGSLTTLLAQIVAPKGKIVSYEKRRDFMDFAIKNLVNIGVADHVEVKEQDITKGIDEKEVDAIVLDIPDPWNAIEHAWKALKIGGSIASYSPLISQVEKTVNALKKHPFIEIKTIETLQREMIVSERGTRPSFDMLGHTGYLTFARKVLKL
ncbi:MAG TPA: tRNA (adenine-N1)-methyltransferase [Thermoplasmatales archaeon]|nr:tRNA (adenine-N1)-methyltransferase [Thermoplasmatales archaeon]